MKTLLILLILTPLTANAIDKDKLNHLKAGIIIGFTVTLGTGKPKYGFMTGCAAGVAKEAYDATGRGTVEFADFAATCAGAGVSSWLMGKVLN